MKKTLYSLMLSDDVVREVDALAHRQGVTRSALVNSILAEYTGFLTPEKRIGDIFSAIDRLLAPQRELIPYFEPNALTMSLKSSLEFKYRPTVRYEVQLYEHSDTALGALSVIFRTQSESLLMGMAAFFRLWKRIEDSFRTAATGESVTHELYEGRFVRSLALPRGRDCRSEELAEAISAYIRLFDSALKGCLAGRLTERDVEQGYLEWLRSGNIII